MATTTNYGWTTPDDTALVKDGAAAIRTLGSSIDTTTKNLNPETTLGDIAYRSSTANVKTRLGIGTTGQVLLVSGGVPAWGSAPATGGMTLLSTTTLSGTTTTISSISGSYNNLQMVIKNVDNGTNNPIFVNPNGDTTNTQFIVCTTQAGGALLEQTRFKTHTNIKAGATDNIFILNWIEYASTSSVKSCYGSVGYLVAPSTYWAGTHGGTWFDNTAISSFTITSPTSFTGGTVLLYGVK